MVTNVLYICFLCFGSTVCGFSVRFFPSSVAGGGDGECVYALAPTCLKTFGVIVWMILLWRKAQTQPNRMKRYEIGVCVCVRVGKRDRFNCRFASRHLFLLAAICTVFFSLLFHFNFSSFRRIDL